MSHPTHQLLDEQCHQIVSDYLQKKGYHRTLKILEMEINHEDQDDEVILYTPPKGLSILEGLIKNEDTTTSPISITVDTEPRLPGRDIESNQKKMNASSFLLPNKFGEKMSRSFNNALDFVSLQKNPSLLAKVPPSFLYNKRSDSRHSRASHQDVSDGMLSVIQDEDKESLDSYEFSDSLDLDLDFKKPNSHDIDVVEYDEVMFNFGLPKETDQEETFEYEDFNLIHNEEDEELQFFNLKIVHAAQHTGFEETADFPIIRDDIIAGRYQVKKYIGSAAFSRAVKCLDHKTENMVCIKIIKNNKDFFDQCLDEIKLLKYLNACGDPHENNILKIYDYFYFKEHLFIVSELLGKNLYEFYTLNRSTQKDFYFTIPRLQIIAKQLLVALKYIHSLNIIHCDLKPENILMKDVEKSEVKIIDFGSSCFFTDELSTYVQSRSYRSPEVMLGIEYNEKIDIWSLGCIIAELYSGNVLFQNNSTQTLMASIIGKRGKVPSRLLKKAEYKDDFYQNGKLYEMSPTGEVNYLKIKKTTLADDLNTDDEGFIDFLSKLLMIDSKERFSATEAYIHPWLWRDY